MNQQAYSVLFCALLASTFVHELRAKGVAPVRPGLKAQEKHGLAVQERFISGNSGCHFECNPAPWVPPHCGLQLLVNANASIIAVVNVTADVAIAVDFVAGIIVILNGHGAAVAINLASQTGVYIKAGLWDVANNVSFQTYLAGLTGLTFLFSFVGAIAFTVATASAAILAFINGVIIYLVFRISLAIVDDATAGIQFLLAFGAGIVLVFTGALKLLIGLIGILRIDLVGDLVWFLNVLQGYCIFFGQITGGLAAVLAAPVTIDLDVLFGAYNGLQALINILFAIGTKVVLGAALVAILSNVQTLFKLIALLGGNVDVGITGLVKVLALIVALPNAAIEVVISALIQFVVATKGYYLSGDLGAEFKATLQVLLDILTQLNLTTSLSGLVKIINDLIGEVLIVAGISISVIIKTILTGLFTGSTTLLTIIVSVLLLLKTVVAPEISLLILLLILIVYLKSYVGVTIIKALGIAIGGNFGGIIGGILLVILSSILSLVLLLLGNIYDVLLSIVVIGDIVLALNTAISIASNGSISLKVILNASALITGLIKGLFQLLTGIYLGVSSVVILQVQALIKLLLSLSGFFAIGIVVSAGGGFSGSVGGNGSIIFTGK